MNDIVLCELAHTCNKANGGDPGDEPVPTCAHSEKSLRTVPKSCEQLPCELCRVAKTKKAIPSVFEGIASTTRHNQLHGTITKLAQRTMIRVAHDDVVQHFDLEKLACADEVAGHFDVGFRRLPAAKDKGPNTLGVGACVQAV